MGLPNSGALSFLDNLTLTTELFITTDFKSLSFNAPRLVAAHPSLDAFLVTSISGSDQRLSLQDLSVIWSGGSIKAGLSVDYSDPREISFSVDTMYNELSYAFQGVLLDREALSIQGSYGLRAQVLLSREDGVNGSMSFEGLPLSFGDLLLSSTANLSLRVRPEGQWKLSLDRFLVENAGTSPAGKLKVEMKGYADQLGGTLSRISLDDAQGPLTGNLHAQWPQGLSSVQFKLKLSDSLLSESYDLDGSVQKGTFLANLTLQKARVERFLAPRAEGTLSGVVGVEFVNPSQYDLTWRISSFDGKIANEPIQLSASGDLTDSQLEMEAVHLVYGNYSADVPRISLNREKSALTADFLVKGLTIGHDALLAAKAEIQLSPFKSWTSIPEAFKKWQVAVSVEQARIGTIEAVNPFKLAIAGDQNGVSLEGGPNDSLRFRSNAEGDFYASLSSPSPLRGTITGRITDGMLDAQTSSLYLDFPALWSLLPTLPVRFTSGSVLASLHISGPVGDPEFEGVARASGLRLVVPRWVKGEIGPVSGDVPFKGNAFTFSLPDVPVENGGRASVDGSFQFDRWIPKNFLLNVRIPDTAGVPVSVDVAGIIGNGKAFGTLTLENTHEDFAVSGALTLENTVITLNTDTLIGMMKEAASPTAVSVNLDITTGKKIEFDWPSADFPIIQGFADAGDTLHIDYDGMSGRYNLLGDIDLRGGEVFYFQRSFYLRKGKLHFAENEVHFSPKITLRAEVYDRNESGPVILAMVVDEAPLLSFTPRLESQPPLSQVEIFALLGQNLTGYTAGGENSLQDTLLTASTDLVAQFNFVHVFERNARDFMKLDMFSVRTQLLQNAILEATGLRSDVNLKDSGGNAVDTRTSLGNYFDNTTVYMGKFIGSDLFLQAMLSLQVDENNAMNAFGGLELRPDIGLEMRTPLFMLNWSFFPTHFENLFIDDHSFTLTWKKSF